MNKLEILTLLREIFGEAERWEHTFLRGRTVLNAIDARLKLAESPPIDVFAEMRQISYRHPQLVLGICPTTGPNGERQTFDIVNMRGGYRMIIRRDTINDAWLAFIERFSFQDEVEAIRANLRDRPPAAQ